MRLNLQSPFLTARWENLVMLNYEIDPAILMPYLPRGTELDTHRGCHFVSIVGFQFLDTRVRGFAIPCHGNFEEVNLRFYVRRTEGNEIRRGVVFICEIVKLRAVATIARWRYNENYLVAPTSHQIRLPNESTTGRVEYLWGDAVGGAEIAGEPSLPDLDSEEAFITEHYWGYSRQRDGRTMEYRVEHPRWRVWQAKQSWLTGNMATFYGEDMAMVLRKPPTTAFVVDGSTVSVANGRRLPD